LLEAHVAVDVRSVVELSVYVPVAANCWEVPKAIEGLGGVTAMDTRAGADTASVVDPFTAPDVAVMVLPPWAVVLASPVEFTVATPVFVEAQPTELVMFCVVPFV
jgi:hypothetical protein